MATYNMQCPMAARRLIHSGMPATIEHGKPMGSSSSAAVAVAETVQHFITTMDSLKLNMVAVDQVYPLLTDLVQSLNKVRACPAWAPHAGGQHGNPQRLARAADALVLSIATGAPTGPVAAARPWREAEGQGVGQQAAQHACELRAVGGGSAPAAVRPGIRI